MVAWMMEHASLLLNAVVRSTDGLTSWKRIRGRAFGHPLVGIGESVLHKHSVKGQHHDLQGNIGAQGGEGVCVCGIQPDQPHRDLTTACDTDCWLNIRWRLSPAG